MQLLLNSHRSKFVRLGVLHQSVLDGTPLSRELGDLTTWIGGGAGKLSVATPRLRLAPHPPATHRFPTTSCKHHRRRPLRLRICPSGRHPHLRCWLSDPATGGVIGYALGADPYPYQSFQESEGPDIQYASWWRTLGLMTWRSLMSRCPDLEHVVEALSGSYRAVSQVGTEAFHCPRQGIVQR